MFPSKPANRPALNPRIPTDPGKYLHPQLHHCLPPLEKHSDEINDEVGSAETAIHHPASRKVGSKQTAKVVPNQTAILARRSPVLQESIGSGRHHESCHSSRSSTQNCELPRLPRVPKLPKHLRLPNSEIVRPVLDGLVYGVSCLGSLDRQDS